MSWSRLTNRAGIFERSGIQGPGINVCIQGADEAVGTGVHCGVGGAEVSLRTGPGGGGAEGGSSGGRPGGVRGQTGQGDFIGEAERSQGEESGQSEDHLHRQGREEISGGTVSVDPARLGFRHWSSLQKPNAAVGGSRASRDRLYQTHVGSARLGSARCTADPSNKAAQPPL